MTPEEYQRLKEAEKEHLRKLKELKTAVRQLERQSRVSRAIENITDGPRALLDENADLVERLAMDAARSEAKLDIALETAAEKDAGSGVSPADLQAREARAEEEMRRIRAQQLLQQLREEAGMPSGTSSTTSAAPRAQADPEKEASKLPEKTIGRMKP